MARQLRRTIQIRYSSIGVTAAAFVLISYHNHPLWAEQKLSAHPAGPANINASPPPEIANRLRVKVGDQTDSLTNVIERNATDPQLANYRDLRAAEGGTADGQRDLARWCRKRRLTEEETLHWRILLSMHPGDQEAIKSLHLKNYRGLLLTSDQIDELKQQDKQSDEATKTWVPKLKKLKRSIERGDADERAAALRELKSIQDPLAIPSLEEVFGIETGVGIQLVEVLSKMPREEAAGPLGRMAVESSDEYVRQKAADTLQSLPYETYVPGLIARLAAPIEMSVSVSVDPGWKKFKEVQWDEFTGRLVPAIRNKIRLHSAYVRSDVLAWGFETAHKSGYMLSENVPDRLRYNYLLSRDSPDPDRPYEHSGSIEDNPAGKKSRKGDSLKDIEDRVAKANAQQAALNEKIHAALNAATGAHIGPENPKAGQFDDVKPKLWWDWWKQQSHTDRYFAPQTSVWTQIGLMPIEQILVGDRVLARDPASGELAFQLVIATNSQPNEALRVLDLGSQPIIATPDQQFYVSGKGWQELRKLAPETKLDCLAEPQAIRQITDEQSHKEFAIVVANTPNYFVGDEGVCVHDATSANVK
jgi:hypothetical protein